MSNSFNIGTVVSSRAKFQDQWSDNYPLLMRRARRLTRDGGQDPEDLSSQATLKVLKYLSLEREIENFVGLMLVSLLQVYQDSNRRVGNRVMDRSEELQEYGAHAKWCSVCPDTERTYIAKRTLNDIFDHLATMPPNIQELFHLRFIHDLSYSEIGQKLDISPACARQKVKTLRGKLRVWIDD
ncbi:RNA polymerase sigma factor [Actibacterium lipolyticum]|uniref:RNA polymerase sigma factor n=1 Tax=Actibacterium lipolyticum TaxID=1524263 RepID=A0A238KK31_9RHOB|nr:sigma-70 family RNA polymerase sigma factor [Actibacterium lipolyticum]SMX43121.1 RNA polymerase sigma factor [Actibacterium lipolyticum]